MPEYAPEPTASTPRSRPREIVDVRPPADFRRAHLPGSWSWPLEDRADWPAGGRPTDAYLAATLPSHLLPPRHTALAVAASSLSTARRVCDALAARGRLALQPLSLGADGEPGDRAGATETGPGRARLWLPPPFLARWRSLLPPPIRGPALDLACGSGRAAVWLARHGWRVTGLDRDPAALVLGRQLAGYEGVAVTWNVADLRNPAAVPPGPWALVTVFRYLHRELVAALAAHVVGGGVAVLRTFRDAPGCAGPPRPVHRLGRLEWTRLLPPEAWELLVLAEGFDEDGRPAAGVVARRRWR